MNKRKAGILNIIISIIFAAAMLLSPYMLRIWQMHEHEQLAINLLIALWIVPFSYLEGIRKGKPVSFKSDFLCIKRKVMGLFNKA
ncbi:MAG: hypothetical protein KDF60_08465 [Calditrichaeota bacterium]|nr:hypothetical protein [Calditrichota bacterium]